MTRSPSGHRARTWGGGGGGGDEDDELCYPDIRVFTNHDSEGMYYNYSISVCESRVVDVYFAAGDGTPVEYAYQDKEVTPEKRLSALGLKRDTDITQLCVSIDGGSACCTRDGEKVCR